MVSIQIKHVPPETHAVLSRRAAEAHQSLQEYLLAMLIAEAGQPTLAQFFDEIEEDFARHGGGSTMTLEEITQMIREDRDSH
jgi:hypothetical protein